MKILLTLVALTQWGELLALEYAAVTFQQVHPANYKVAKKSMEFVNKMRQDLRRNNDDYAQKDIEGLSQLESPSVRAHPAPRHPNRKRYPAPHRLSPSNRAGPPQRYYIDTRRGKAVNVLQGDVAQSDVNLTTVFRSYTRVRPVKKSLRMSKLKMTLNREKNKLRAADDGQGRTEMDLMEADDTTSSTLPSTVPTRPIPLTPPPSLPPPPTSRPRRKHTPRPAMRDSALSEEPMRQASPGGNPLPDQTARQASPRNSPLPDQTAPQASPPDSPLSNKPERQAPPRGSPLSEKPARQTSPRDSLISEELVRQTPLQDYPLSEEPERLAPLHDTPLLKKPARQRNSPLSEERPARQVMRSTQRNPAPQPDQIDMAHARNPVITRIRMKGRLCQRSLMNIEGPMYDKEGKQVLPAHHPRLAHGRQFHETRAPELVLPKCCNCCKKSVLGCQ